MNTLETFKLVQWDAQDDLIGQHHVLTYNLVTPRQTITRVVWATDNDHLFHLSASDSFDPKLAESILDNFIRLDLSPLRDGYVTVVEAAFNTSAFETIVIAPQQVQLFDHLPEELRSKMYMVTPAFRSEFHDGMSAKEWRHQLGRKDGWRIYPYLWNRVEKRTPSFP